MKVSVIIPTYNRAEILRQTVDSILNQTFQDFEIILIDDGSSDHTEEVFTDYSDKLRYIKQENAGVNAARNHALRVAQGEYIAMLDDDDVWLDYKLKLQVEILDKLDGIGFTYSNFYILKSDGTRIPDGLTTWLRSPIDWSSLFEDHYHCRDLSIESSIPDADRQEPVIYVGDIYHASLYEPHVLPSTAVFRRSLLPDDLRFAEHDSICGDWEFFARFSKLHKAAFLNHETTLNRSHEDAFRLTRTDHDIQMGKRRDFIRRLWKADEQFYRENKSSVDGALNKVLVELAYLHVMSGNIEEASAAMNDLARPYTGLNKKQLYISRIGTGIPLSSNLFRLIRNIKQSLH
ncbi:MAG: glycosyltransferase family 2 protein [Candidatus Thiodiazotropha sp.]